MKDGKDEVIALKEQVSLGRKTFSYKENSRLLKCYKVKLLAIKQGEMKLLQRGEYIENLSITHFHFTYEPYIHICHSQQTRSHQIAI
ncbi:hypothetical protein KW850_06620 [Bacillus sp. sid0103]|nr:hypothetical protein [Bacillus sp. sid0103]